MTLAQSMLGEFDHEMANTRKTLARIPDAKFGYKPHPKSMSMGDVASHIVHMIGWATVTMEQDNFDFAPGGKMIQMPAFKTTAELLAAFDRDLPKARAAIAAGSDAAMARPWALLNNGQKMFEMPRGAVIRSMILNHIIHHRAQLAVYLRLNDLPVPALYGPSADEK